MAWNPAIIQAAAGAGSGIFGSIMSSESAKKNTQRTIKANKDMAEYAYDRDYQMWLEQNAYNSPEAQMQRLKEAGLNPNMIYGTGTASTGNASSAPKFQAPSAQYNYKPLDLSFIPDVIARYQDVRMRQAQIDNVQANTANVQQKTLNEAVQNFLLKLRGVDTQKTLEEKRLSLWHEKVIGGQAEAAMYQGTTAMIKAKQEWERLQAMTKENQMKLLNIQAMEKRMTSLDLENERKRAQLIFERQKAEWSKMGVTTSDHPLLRIYARLLQTLDF